MKIEFTPWRLLDAEFRTDVIRRFLARVRDSGVARFRRGVTQPPKTGRFYRRGGGLHQASVNRDRAEYPANDTGRLRSSISGDVTQWSATIGSNAPYSGYLADGTRKMAPRKMSRDALQDVVPKELARMGRWARFK